MSLLKKWLAKHKLTQNELSIQVGCTTAFLNGLINEKNTDVKISLLDRLHKATSIPMDKLVKDLLSSKKPEDKHVPVRGARSRPKSSKRKKVR